MINKQFSDFETGAPLFLLKYQYTSEPHYRDLYLIYVHAQPVILRTYVDFIMRF